MNHPVTLPQSLIQRLENLSATSRHTPQSFIKQAITENLDYEEWALAQVDVGIADIEAGRVSSHEEVASRMKCKIGATCERKATSMPQELS